MKTVFQFLDIGGNDLRVIGDDRAVIVVIAEVFVKVIRHAGVEHCVHALVKQRFHVAVHQLCREARRIGRNGVLTL